MVVNKREIIHHESAVCEYRKVKCHNCVKIEQDVEEMKEKMEKEVGAMKEQVVSLKVLNVGGRDMIYFSPVSYFSPITYFSH
jgi:glutamine synthetase adenylyltransferase